MASKSGGCSLVTSAAIGDYIVLKISEHKHISNATYIMATMDHTRAHNSKVFGQATSMAVQVVTHCISNNQAIFSIFCN